LRPTSEIYNMAWAGPSTDKPVWCATTGKAGASAAAVSCVTKKPEGVTIEMASVQNPGQQSGTRLEPHPLAGEGQTVSDVSPIGSPAMPTSYKEFHGQMELGRFLTEQYHIRTPNELSSCEVCHR